MRPADVLARARAFVAPTALTRRAGFLLILEPFETENATVPNPIFHFVYVRVLSSPSRHRRVPPRARSRLVPWR